jgi:hypothetical protein
VVFSATTERPPGRDGAFSWLFLSVVRRLCAPKTNPALYMLGCPFPGGEGGEIEAGTAHFLINCLPPWNCVTVSMRRALGTTWRNDPNWVTQIWRPRAEFSRV